MPRRTVTVGKGRKAVTLTVAGVEKWVKSLEGDWDTKRAGRIDDLGSVLGDYYGGVVSVGQHTLIVVPYTTPEDIGA